VTNVIVAALKSWENVFHAPVAVVSVVFIVVATLLQCLRVVVVVVVGVVVVVVVAIVVCIVVASLCVDCGLMKSFFAARRNSFRCIKQGKNIEKSLNMC